MEIILLALVGAVVFLIWYSQTPAGKQEKEKEEKKRQEIERSIQNQQKRDIDEYNKRMNEAGEELLVKGDILKQELTPLFQQLETQFDENIANEILKKLGVAEYRKDVYVDSQFFYNTALDLIITHSGYIKAKVFALKIGRWHFGRLKFSGEPSTRDEQTIQNDINTRI
ncbi:MULTISPECIES: hypothetical protein [Pseudanabaena]|uniref:hypothetical protein n=1 Tax=Pseudanabaena TaxID=1152 RepID=UPI0024797C29|nr:MULTISPECIES: hypothetical protein [Pseudanabaena]MEA5485635.1 hypothetical protein [Pseudanabaena sp. CCNP1317]WGS71979.1 hypothetical protein OA858_20085 [Pseudanabaena galeata CCNP1313]